MTGSGGCLGSDLSELQRDADAICAVGVTGVQVRVITPEGRDFVVTSGVADVKTGRSVPSDGYFRIGSNTKTFTATVILQLVGAGELSLDDSVERWLPGVVHGNDIDGRKITILHLLQHHSGIHDDIPDFVSARDYYRRRYDIYSPEQLVARAMRHRPDFSPGEGWNYCNTGYILLGMIIQKVTKHTWYEEVTKRIIGPLGLKNTRWPGISPELPNPHAESYQSFPDRDLVNVTEHCESHTAGCAGGLIGTSVDVARFFRALLGGRLLRPAELAQMQQTVPIRGELEQFWPCARDGLGIFSRPLSCGGVYWSHAGDITGYMTRNGFIADGRRGVVVSMSTELQNSTDNLLRQDKAAAALIDRALCKTD